MSATRALQIGKRVVLRLFAFVLVALLIFMFIEGFCSTALLVAHLRPSHVLRERSDPIYMHYDPELGWINDSHVYHKNMFGPGVYLRTNAQGFRNARTISQNVPSGRTRVLCSGDSFTFGYGVDNRQTWCALLSSMDEQLQTVNMGQNGYGVDQSYLLYKRASSALHYQVQIFAFISEDFHRMENNFMFGSGKPVLSVHDGRLVVHNVPVPKQFIRSKLADWQESYGPVLDQSRTVQFVTRVAKHLHLTAPTSVSHADQQKWDSVVAAILASLNTMNKGKHSTLVLVFLPTAPDQHSNALLNQWEPVVRNDAAKDHIIFIDLVHEFQNLPAHEVPQLFIQPGTSKYAGEVGHYTTEGNQYIAKKLYSRLLQLGILDIKNARGSQASRRTANHTQKSGRTPQKQPKSLSARALRGPAQR